MDRFCFIKKYSKIHFIGIGGVSMSALAKYCLLNKVIVSGSDRSCSEEIELLRSLGAEVYVEHQKSLPNGVEAVVYTSAIGEDNLELLSAKEKGVDVYKRSEFLGEIVKEFKCSVAVCGCHGKTTTTAMLSEVFITAGYNPTVFLGGDYKGFGNFYNGYKDFVVLEACEYKKNFLDIKPNSVIVTNVDNDHLDSYKNLEEEKECFNQFIKNSVAFVNADDKNSKSLYCNCVVSYGIREPACYTANNIKEVNGKQAFTVYAYGRRLGRIKISLRGIHNVYNALSVVAYADENKVPFYKIKKGLENFEGVKRRDEFIGRYKNYLCFSDYAHHPSEIDALLSSRNNIEKILVVFQPHTYSRTKFLMEDFVKVLSKVKNLIIYKTYPARESFDEEGDGKKLYKKIKNINKKVRYLSSIEELKKEISAFNDVEEIYFVGAGDLYDVVRKKLFQINAKNNLQNSFK